MKIGRNDLCPCGSGRKYKKCCMYKKSNDLQSDLKVDYYKKYKIRLKETKDIEGIKRAGNLVVDTLNMVEKYIEPGLSKVSVPRSMRLSATEFQVSIVLKTEILLT